MSNQYQNQKPPQQDPSYTFARIAYDQNCIFVFSRKCFKASPENLYGLTLGFAYDSKGYPICTAGIDIRELHRQMTQVLFDARTIYFSTIDSIDQRLKTQIADAVIAFDAQAAEHVE